MAGGNDALNAWFDLYGYEQEYMTLTAPMTPDTLALALHDVVAVELPRWNYGNGGKNYRITGITLDGKARKIQFTLWRNSKP